MNILGIDTSCEVGSIAFSQSGKLLFYKEWAQRGPLDKSLHAEELILEISFLLKQMSIELQDLNLLAVDIGPGRFTGVRVAVNAIRSLSFALNIPIAAYSSLHILAEEAPYEGTLLTTINAFQNKIFCAEYEKQSGLLKELRAPFTCQVDALNEFLSENIFLIENKSPKASALVAMAFQDYTKNNKLSWKELIPLYLRPSSAEEKLKI